LPDFCSKKEVKNLKGKVKRLIRDRGFGFITAEDGTEVFFHRTDLAEADFDTMEEGADVEFDLESGAKGPRAVKVKVTTES
jgi:CspA family cold shock protein